MLIIQVHLGNCFPSYETSEKVVQFGGIRWSCGVQSVFWSVCLCQLLLFSKFPRAPWGAGSVLGWEDSGMQSRLGGPAPPLCLNSHLCACPPAGESP